MSKLPEKLNNRLITISLFVLGYAGFECYKGGGLVWHFIFGLFAYLFLAGMWQALRKKGP